MQRFLGQPRFWLSVSLVGALAVACSEYDSSSSGNPTFPKPGAPCTGEGAPKCGAHGHCAEGSSGAAATCACDEGYTGAACADCAAGLQDDDHDGVCAPKCGDKSCAAHERCTAGNGPPTCACAPGYAAAQSDSGCVWAGVVKDPTFSNTPNGAWELENASLDPTVSTATGGGALSDPGAAVATPSTATCPDKIARVRQTFEMPSALESEPLALTTRAFGVNCGFFGLGCLGFPKWRNEGRLLTPLDIFVFNGNGTTRTYCLGERWYGRTVKLEHDITGGCASATFYQDHTEIAPAAECALPGSVYNANFEGNGGWDVSNVDADSIAEVKESIGTNGSRAGHLAGKRYCKNPTISGSISIPEVAGKKVALSLSYKGSLGDSANVYLGPFSLGALKGLNAFETAKFCLPDATKGLAWPLRIALPNVPAPSGFDCTTATGTRDFIFDDLALVADATCPDAVPIADPTFDERPANTPQWVAESDGISNAVIQAGGRAGRAAVLSTAKYCHSASINSLLSMPEFDATEGYAIRFFQKGNVPAGQSLTTTFGDVPVSAAWEQRTQCLPHTFAGSAYNLSFSASFNVGGSCEANASSMIWIDDIDLVKDPTCVGK